MKQNKYRALAFIAIITSLMLVACGDMESGHIYRRTPVEFSPSMADHTLATRADNGRWTGNEAVGIAMLQASDNGLTATHTFMEYAVIRSGASSSSLMPAGENNTLYYPEGGDAVTFTAFVPLVPVEGTTVTYPALGDQKSPEKMELVDFMYCPNTGEYTKNSADAAKLTFTHKFSKLRVEISSPNDATGVDLTTINEVLLSNLPGSASVDLANLSILPGEPTATTVFCNRTVTTTLATYEAIVVPHTATDTYTDRTMTISSDALGNFTYTLADEFEFASGKIYTLRFRVSNERCLEETGEAVISDWETGTITWDGYTYDSGTDETITVNKDGELHTMTFATTYPGNLVSATVTYEEGKQADWVSIANNNPAQDAIADARINYTCHFTVAPNTRSSLRTAYLTIKIDRIEKTYNILQEGCEVATLVSMEPKEATLLQLLPNAQTGKTFSFKTNYSGSVIVKWSISDTDPDAGMPDWVVDGDISTPVGSISPEGEHMYTYSYSYGLEAHTANIKTARKAYAHVTAGGDPLVFTIEQDCIRFSGIGDNLNHSTVGGRASFTFSLNYADAIPAVASINCPTNRGYPWFENYSFTKVSTNTNGLTEYVCSYNVTRNLDGRKREGTVTLTAGTDLGAPHEQKMDQDCVEATSNSYMIVPDGRAIVIPVRKRIEEYIALTGDYEKDPGYDFSVELLWMDAPGLVFHIERADDINEGAIRVVSNYSNTEGNAVVAVRANGEIKWSWHIWVTNYEPQGSTWMNRNLGATSATPSTVATERAKTFGLLYQWGRKDPFPNSSTETVTEPTIYYAMNDYSGSRYTLNKQTAQQTISWTLSNPDKFITFSGSWMTSPTNNDINWIPGGKSIYDPCPEGYRIPTVADWGGSQTAWSRFTYNSTYKGIDTESVYGGWYPANTYRLNGGGIQFGGVLAYWTAIVPGTGNASGLFGSGSITLPYIQFARSTALSIRCRK